MSQNPYATPYPQQQYTVGYPPTYGAPSPARTSVMAVLSLVLSLLCCTAPLGVIFGGLALVGIGLSGGKVKGVGIAIAGLIIGIILSAMWIGFFVAMGQGIGMFGTLVTPALKGVEQRDVSAVQAQFAPAQQASIDQERVDAFAQALKDEYGTFDRLPDGLGEWIGQFGESFSDATSMQALQRAQQTTGDNIMPLPALFDTGWHTLLIGIDETSNAPALADIGLVQSDGTIVWLVDSGPGPTIPRFVPPRILEDIRRQGDTPEAPDAEEPAGEEPGAGDAPAPARPTRTNRPSTSPK